MIQILQWLLLEGRRVVQVLEALAALSVEAAEVFAVEEVSVYRILHLFSRVYVRLQSFPVPEVFLPSALEERKDRARAVLQALSSSSARASPLSLPAAFHRRYFPHLLFDMNPGL